jgi:hypothetical protein
MTTPNTIKVPKNRRTIKVDGTLIGFVDVDTMTFIPAADVKVAPVAIDPAATLIDRDLVTVDPREVYGDDGLDS